MPDEIAYICRNLNARTLKTVEDFQKEVSQIMSEATLAGALHNSRTFIRFWEVGVQLLERDINSAIQFVYNHTGQHTGEVYDQVAYCSSQMVERILQDVRARAGVNDQAFGGGYAEIVDRMQTAMQEKRERLLDDFKHGMIGSERLKKDAVVNVINNQTNSPGAIQQVGVGDNFSQQAFAQNHQELVLAIEKALASQEFAELQQDQKEAYSDTALVVKEEAAKAQPDAGKLKRWGRRLVDLGRDLGMKVATAEIVNLLAKMFGG
ncbi:MULTISPECIES: hypothetical protein [unclassified Bradyrhizobium]|uniref:hypothetical protein n=1 Tax=unclassified Bradyrhizobium TaxID=2631580 RepID=UPI0028E7CB79|nr:MULTISPECIES: hypothetical protein [unclassified Bradyrhizobium]